MKIVGLIPARGGSKGIKNKNVVLLGKKPLVYYTIKEAQTSKLNNLYCSTDSNKVREVCIKYRCKIVHRPKNLSDDNASMLSVVKHFWDHLNKINEPFDAVMLLYPTYPFRTSELINSAIAKYKSLENSQVMICFHIPSTHPYLCYEFSKRNTFHSIMEFDINKNYRRQEYLEYYELSHIVSIIPKDKIDSINNQLYDDDSVGFIIEKSKQSLNIDTPMDLAYAEFLFNKK